MMNNDFSYEILSQSLTDIDVFMEPDDYLSHYGIKGQNGAFVVIRILMELLLRKDVLIIKMFMKN